jgi:hypothetical protein
VRKLIYKSLASLLCVSLVWSSSEGAQTFAHVWASSLSPSISNVFTEQALASRATTSLNSPPQVSIGTLYFHLPGKGGLTQENTAIWLQEVLYLAEPLSGPVEIKEALMRLFQTRWLEGNHEVGDWYRAVRLASYLVIADSFNEGAAPEAAIERISAVFDDFFDPKTYKEKGSVVSDENINEIVNRLAAIRNIEDFSFGKHVEENHEKYVEFTKTVIDVFLHNNEARAAELMRMHTQSPSAETPPPLAVPSFEAAASNGHFKLSFDLTDEHRVFAAKLIEMLRYENNYPRFRALAKNTGLTETVPKDLPAEVFSLFFNNDGRPLDKKGVPLALTKLVSDAQSGPDLEKILTLMEKKRDDRSARLGSKFLRFAFSGTFLAKATGWAFVKYLAVAIVLVLAAVWAHKKMKQRNSLREEPLDREQWQEILLMPDTKSILERFRNQLRFATFQPAAAMSTDGLTRDEWQELLTAPDRGFRNWWHDFFNDKDSQLTWTISHVIGPAIVFVLFVMTFSAHGFLPVHSPFADFLLEHNLWMASVIVATSAIDVMRRTHSSVRPQMMRRMLFGLLALLLVPTGESLIRHLATWIEEPPGENAPQPEIIKPAPPAPAIGTPAVVPVIPTPAPVTRSSDPAFASPPTILNSPKPARVPAKKKLSPTPSAPPSSPPASSLAESVLENLPLPNVTLLPMNPVVQTATQKIVTITMENLLEAGEKKSTAQKALFDATGQREAAEGKPNITVAPTAVFETLGVHGIGVNVAGSVPLPWSPDPARHLEEPQKLVDAPADVLSALGNFWEAQRAGKPLDIQIASDQLKQVAQVSLDEVPADALMGFNASSFDEQNIAQIGVAPIASRSATQWKNVILQSHADVVRHFRRRISKILPPVFSANINVNKGPMGLVWGSGFGWKTYGQFTWPKEASALEDAAQNFQADRLKSIDDLHRALLRWKGISANSPESVALRTTAEEVVDSIYVTAFKKTVRPAIDGLEKDLEKKDKTKNKKKVSKQQVAVRAVLAKLDTQVEQGIKPPENPPPAPEKKLSDPDLDKPIPALVAAQVAAPSFTGTTGLTSDAPYAPTQLSHHGNGNLGATLKFLDNGRSLTRGKAKLKAALKKNEAAEKAQQAHPGFKADKNLLLARVEVAQARAGLSDSETIDLGLSAQNNPPVGFYVASLNNFVRLGVTHGVSLLKKIIPHHPKGDDPNLAEVYLASEEAIRHVKDLKDADPTVYQGWSHWFEADPNTLPSDERTLQVRLLGVWNETSKPTTSLERRIFELRLAQARAGVVPRGIAIDLIPYYNPITTAGQPNIHNMGVQVPFTLKLESHAAEAQKKADAVSAAQNALLALDAKEAHDKAVEKIRGFSVDNQNEVPVLELSTLADANAFAAKYMEQNQLKEAAKVKKSFRAAVWGLVKQNVGDITGQYFYTFKWQHGLHGYQVSSKPHPLFDRGQKRASLQEQQAKKDLDKLNNDLLIRSQVNNVVGLFHQQDLVLKDYRAAQAWYLRARAEAQQHPEDAELQRTATRAEHYYEGLRQQLELTHLNLQEALSGIPVSERPMYGIGGLHLDAVTLVVPVPKPMSTVIPEVPEKVEIVQVSVPGPVVRASVPARRPVTIPTLKPATVGQQSYVSYVWDGWKTSFMRDARATRAWLFGSPRRRVVAPGPPKATPEDWYQATYEAYPLVFTDTAEPEPLRLVSNVFAEFDRLNPIWGLASANVLNVAETIVGRIGRLEGMQEIVAQNTETFLDFAAQTVTVYLQKHAVPGHVPSPLIAQAA